MKLRVKPVIIIELMELIHDIKFDIYKKKKYFLKRKIERLKGDIFESNKKNTAPFVLRFIVAVEFCCVLCIFTFS